MVQTINFQVWEDSYSCDYSMPLIERGKIIKEYVFQLDTNNSEPFKTRLIRLCKLLIKKNNQNENGDFILSMKLDNSRPIFLEIVGKEEFISAFAVSFRYDLIDLIIKYKPTLDTIHEVLDSYIIMNKLTNNEIWTLQDILDREG